MAESKVAGLDKQLKAGGPLPARYQAAEAKVARAQGQQDAALVKVEALQEATDQLVEVEQDLAAKS